MELGKFIENTLTGIAEGVKNANKNKKITAGKPQFSLKNAGWYEDKNDGCVWFNLAVSNQNENVIVNSEQGNTHNEHPNRISFNVVNVNAIA